MLVATSASTRNLAGAIGREQGMRIGMTRIHHPTGGFLSGFVPSLPTYRTNNTSDASLDFIFLEAFIWVFRPTNSQSL